MSAAARGPSAAGVALVVLALAASLLPEVDAVEAWWPPGFVLGRLGHAALGIAVVVAATRDLLRGVRDPDLRPEPGDLVGLALGAVAVAAALHLRLDGLLDADELSGLPAVDQAPWTVAVADLGLPSRAWAWLLVGAGLVGRTEVLVGAHAALLLAWALLTHRFARRVAPGPMAVAVTASVVLGFTAIYQFQQLRAYALFCAAAAWGTLGLAPSLRGTDRPGAAWIVGGFGLGALDDPILLVPLLAAALGAWADEPDRSHARAQTAWTLLVALVAAPLAWVAAADVDPGTIAVDAGVELSRWWVARPLAGGAVLAWFLLAAPARDGGARGWAAATAGLLAVVGCTALDLVANDPRVLLPLLPLVVAWPAGAIVEAARGRPALAALAPLALALDQAAVAPEGLAAWLRPALAGLGVVGLALAWRVGPSARRGALVLGGVAAAVVVGLRGLDLRDDLAWEGRRRAALGTLVEHLAATSPPAASSGSYVEALVFTWHLRDRFGTAVGGTPQPWRPAGVETPGFRLRTWDRCTGEHGRVATLGRFGRSEPCALCATEAVFPPDDPAWRVVRCAPAP